MTDEEGFPALPVKRTWVQALAGLKAKITSVEAYEKEHDRLWCNCHNGEYNMAGQVVAGPPPRPLKEFKVDF